MKMKKLLGGEVEKVGTCKGDERTAFSRNVGYQIIGFGIQGSFTAWPLTDAWRYIGCT